MNIFFFALRNCEVGLLTVLIKTLFAVSFIFVDLLKDCEAIADKWYNFNYCYKCIKVLNVKKLREYQRIYIRYTLSHCPSTFKFKNKSTRLASMWFCITKNLKFSIEIFAFLLQTSNSSFLYSFKSQDSRHNIALISRFENKAIR